MTDFTQIYNSKSTQTIPMSPAVMAVIGDKYAREDLTDYVLPVSRGEHVTIDVGYLRPGKNMNDPPHLKYDHNNLLTMMESIRDKKMDVAERCCVEFFSTDPELTDVAASPFRHTVSRAETNAEYCLFSTAELDGRAIQAGYKGIALLNPSKGTYHRYAKVYPLLPVKVFVTDNDSDYLRMLNIARAEYNNIVPIVYTPFSELPDTYMYYTGYKTYAQYPKAYIGFTPNPVAMAGAGVKVSAVDDYSFKYNRKGIVEHVEYVDHPMVRRADFLLYKFQNTSQFMRNQGVLHDLVSTMKVEIHVPIIKSRPIPADMLVPVQEGRLERRNDGIYIGTLRLMNQFGVKDHDAWKLPDKLLTSRYVSTDHHTNIYDIGEYFLASATSGKGFEFLGITYTPDLDGDVLFRRSRSGYLKYRNVAWNREVPRMGNINLAKYVAYTEGGVEMFAKEFQYPQLIEEVELITGEMLKVRTYDGHVIDKV